MTLKEFCKAVNRCGFKVFRDREHTAFYKIYFEDDENDINKLMGEFFNCEHPELRKAELYPPIKYTYLHPTTSLCGKEFDDPQELQIQLLENLFMMKKYVFEYRENFYTGKTI